MASLEEIFNASQFVIMNCVKNLSDVHGNLQDEEIFSAGTNLGFLDGNLLKLRKLISLMEKEEYGDDSFEYYDISESSESSESTEE